MAYSLDVMDSLAKLRVHSSTLSFIYILKTFFSGWRVFTGDIERRDGCYGFICNNCFFSFPILPAPGFGRRMYRLTGGQLLLLSVH